MAKKKMPDIFLEFEGGNKPVHIADVQKAVRGVRGTVSAHVNLMEACVCCVLENGDTREVNLL